MADGFITRKGGGVNVKDATATENDVLQGETFYSGDKDIKTGNIPSKGAETFTPTTTNQTISSGQYLTGTQTILGDSDLVPDNIRDGTTIFGVTGTLTPPPTYYLSFDGVDDYVTTFDSTYLNDNNWTIEIMFEDNNPNDNISTYFGTYAQAEGETTGDFAIQKNDGDYMFFGDTFSTRIHYFNTSSIHNQEVHLAVSKNGTTYKLYVNGQLDKTINNLSGTLDTTFLQYIGSRGNNDRYLEGNFYQLRIWSDTRSDTEILNNYDIYLTGNENNLFTYYDFQDGSGTTLVDQAGNNDGTIVGATWEQE